MKRKYLYISGALNNPVIKSQVMNWLEVLQDHGIVFDLMCCIPFHHLLRKWKGEKVVLDYYRKRLRGKIYIVPIIRSKNIRLDISTLIKLMFLIAYKMTAGRGARLAIQSRSRYNFTAVNIFMKIFANSCFVYDMRGAATAEFLDSFIGITKPDDLSKHNSLKYIDTLRSEKRMVNLSKITTCVSHKLKEYVINQGLTDSEAKIVVVPGAADSSVFFYDEILRTRIRAEEGFDDKKILIYCGSLSHYWHKSELVFEFAAHIISNHTDAIFLCLTKDLDGAYALRNKNQINNDRIDIRFVSDSHVINELYNAADIAIAFRDDITTNRVASPTKIAEYLLSGLPVLISNSIGDFSCFVESNGFGVVSNNSLEDLLKGHNRLLGTDFDRSEIARISAEHYSKQKVAEICKMIYSSI